MVPAVDDELAKKLGFEDLDELRDIVHASESSANTTSCPGCG